MSRYHVGVQQSTDDAGHEATVAKTQAAHDDLAAHSWEHSYQEVTPEAMTLSTLPW